MSKRENISIHALREEGDLPVSTICTASCKFLSTPSARRATHFCFRGPHCVVISIHALREEGDIQDRPETPKGGISIHALREEGDPVRLPWWCQSSYFYPRPPRGGRHQRSGEPGCGGRISIHALREEGDASSESAASTKRQFLSTPSARRATLPRLPEKPYMEISIHALREEGDPGCHDHCERYAEFLSTPSARRATAVMQCHPSPLEFLSTPSARRATTAMLGHME